MKIETYFHSNKLKDVLKTNDIAKLERCFNDFLLESQEKLYKTCETAELSVHFLDDAEIKAINKGLRQKNKPTDVLSWKMYDEKIVTNQLFGEILISDEYNINQAKQKQIPLEHELMFLITHGFLHICGYTHNNDVEEKSMNQDTLKILKEIGIDYSEDII